MKPATACRTREELAQAVVSRRILEVVGLDDIEDAMSVLQEIVSTSSARARQQGREAARGLSRLSEKP